MAFGSNPIENNDKDCLMRDRPPLLCDLQKSIRRLLQDQMPYTNAFTF